LAASRGSGVALAATLTATFAATEAPCGAAAIVAPVATAAVFMGNANGIAPPCIPIIRKGFIIGKPGGMVADLPLLFLAFGARFPPLSAAPP
jgi:hypothetical protein